MSTGAQTLFELAEGGMGPQSTTPGPNRSGRNPEPLATHGQTQDPRTVVLTIPMAAELINLNQRLHWAKRAKMTKAWRQAGRLMARADNLPKGLQRIHVTATVHKDHSRPYDVHNLIPTAKAIIDGLADYGPIPDDSNGFLVGPDMRAGAKGKPRITLEIRVLRGATETLPDEA